MENSFSETHPSLKELVCDSEDWPLKDHNSFPTLDVVDVQKHTVDKAVLRATIEKATSRIVEDCIPDDEPQAEIEYQHFKWFFDIWLRTFKEELGLDKDGEA